MNQDIKISAAFDTKRFTAQANTSAKQKLLPSSNDVEYYSTDSYAESWKEITGLAFSRGDTNASSRSVTMDSFVQAKSNFLSFSPSYKGTVSSTYKNSSLATRTESINQAFVFPFALKNWSFSLRWQKTAGGISNIQRGGTYRDDVEETLYNLKDKGWYFRSPPLQDLFSKTLAEEVAKAAGSSSSVASLYYSTLYTAEWKRNFLGNAKDFFIPSGASLALERDIKRASSSTDVYQIKGMMNFNALNIFGKKSALRWISFFEQDEYITSVTATLRIPRETPAETTVLVSFYQQCVLYFSPRNTLKTGLEISFEDKDNLSAKTTLIWKRPGSKSPFAGMVSRLLKPYNKEKESLSRTDSLNIAFYRASSSSSSDSGVKKRQTCDYSHILDIKLNSFTEINTSLGLSYSCIWEEIITLGASAGIGATIKF